MYGTFFAAATFGSLMLATNAHMIMNTPTPYGFSTLETSPLNGEGLNFPCQSGTRTDAFDADGASNPMVVGHDNVLNFTGSAVHGGGSCQLSITYEYPPPNDKSKWKVIHSYIGGCPAFTAGNLPSDFTTDGRPDAVHCTSPDQTDCVKVLSFQIPSGMKNGNATLAWTWFNNIGNREMYMNCAPISISGGASDDTYFNSLPDMFVANIPGECTTNGAGGVIGFPDPGTTITTFAQPDADAQGSCPAAGSTTQTSSGSQSDSGSDSDSSAAAAGTTSAAASSAAAATDTATLSSFVQAGVTTQAAQTTFATLTAASSAAVATASSSADASDTSSNGTASTGSCAAGSVTCTTPGAVTCIGSDQWGMCNIDNCAVPMALAAGTVCENGVIGAASRKRSVERHLRSHRRVSGGVHSWSF